MSCPRPSRSGQSCCRQGEARQQHCTGRGSCHGRRRGGWGTDEVHQQGTVGCRTWAGVAFATSRVGTAAPLSLRSILLLFHSSMPLPGHPWGLAAGDCTSPCSVCWTSGVRAGPGIRLRQTWRGWELCLEGAGRLGGLPCPCQQCTGQHRLGVFDGRATGSGPPPGQSRPCRMTTAFPDYQLGWCKALLQV